MATRKTSTRKKLPRKSSTTRKKTSARKAAARKLSARKSAARKRTPTGKSAPRKRSDTKRRTTRKWSAHVTETSDALDLQGGVFKGRDPHKIALSLKRSAEHSRRKKGSGYQSAMSMLNFYINRAGHNLSASRRKTLDAAKDELREVFGRKPAK